MHYHVAAGNPHLLDPPVTVADTAREALAAAAGAVAHWLDDCRQRHAAASAHLAGLGQTLAVRRTPTQDDRILALLGAPTEQVGLAAGVELDLCVPCRVEIRACYDPGCALAANSGPGR